MGTQLLTLLASVRKALGGLLGGATGVGVAALLRLLHVDLAPELTTAIAAVLAALGAYLAKPNAVVATTQKTGSADTPTA